MPTKELIGGNKITERMLVPHLRKRSSSKSVYEIITAQEEELLLTCGENITQGTAITIGTDGKAYIANSLNNKPAFAFAKTAGNTNEQISLQIEKIIDTEITGTITIGSYVYLRSNGGIGTIERTNAGDLVQIVGTKIDENRIEISIFEPEKIE